jgi:FeS assembly SUF system protein
MNKIEKSEAFEHEAGKTLPEPCAHTIEAVRESRPSGGALSSEEIERLSTHIIAALKTVYDPEIPVDIYELGLVYRIEIDDDRNVELDMTLTAPGCPVAGDMLGCAENAVSSVEGVDQVKVNLVFTPPWDVSRMSEEARVALNML